MRNTNDKRAACTEKSESEKRALIIKAFADPLDKHCSSEQDVIDVIYSMLAMQQHLNKLLEYRVPNVGFWIRSMRKDVVNKNLTENVQVFDAMSDGFLDALDVISHYSKGLELISNLQDDLEHAI